MPQLSNIAAVVFDMDGVLIDSEYVYRDEIGRFFSANGIDLSIDTLNAQVGASHKDYLAFLETWWERGKGEKIPGAELARRVDALNRAEGPLDYAAILNPGVPETLAQLKEQGYRLALASSSLIGNIRHVLDVCGLTDAFELIVSGGDFHESKPNPEIYLHTVAELGLEPEQCAAVEDSIPGITAARRAGLTVIAKREERFGFSQDGADYIADDVPAVLDVLAGNVAPQHEQR